MSMNMLQAIKKMNGFRRSDIHWERRSLAPGALCGKQVAMIGGTNGIGRALARLFAAKEAEVVVVGRTFRDQGVERLRFIAADLSHMTQAQRVGQELPVEIMDTLIFTTGSGPGEQRAESSEGVELDLAISSLSRFVITRNAAKRVLTKAIRRHGVPEKITIGGSEANEAAIKSNNQEHGTSIEIPQLKYVNNIIEEDHRGVKRVTRPLLGFTSFEAAQ
jgi:NAD(P)-dependent dehydrogenase (short-subunit alcohol dehydrogenase family)